MFKSLILPHITFIGSCTIIPKEYIQTFKNIVYEFLWKGKTDPVKRSVLSNDYLEGGDKSPHNFREIRKQIIWGNKYIKYKGKCLVKVNWIKSGIIIINVF